MNDEIKTLGVKLGFRKDEDWYSLNYETIEKELRAKILRNYKWSPYLIAKSVVKDKKNFHEWLMKGQAPKGFWKKDENIKRYFNWLKKKKNIKTKNDFYKLKGKDINVQLLRKFNDRLIDLLRYLYPNIKFYPWLFQQSHLNFWSKVSNQKEYFDWLEKKIKIKKIEDWYNIELSVFKKNKGPGLLKAYNSTFIKILRKFRPQHKWLPWLFKIKQMKFGKTKAERHQYIKWFENKNNIKKIEDWYKFSNTDIVNDNGGWLLERYKPSSIREMLKEFYPKFVWEEWLFDRTKEGFFNSKENLKRYFDWLYKELNFKKMEDFYTITNDVLDYYNGRGLTNTYPVYSDAIIKAYPKIQWDKTRFGIYKKTQKNLYNLVKEILPKERVIWEFRDSQKLRYRYSTNAKFEIDIYIPSKKIGIEYQGEQHFRRSWKFNNPIKKFKRLQERDKEKRIICKEEGITLLEVLYTWKGDKYSIEKMLSKYF